MLLIRNALSSFAFLYKRNHSTGPIHYDANILCTAYALKQLFFTFNKLITNWLIY